MVVQSVALPAVSRPTREHEIESEAVAPTIVEPMTDKRVQRAAVLTLVVATQVAWLSLLGYGALRLLG